MTQEEILNTKKLSKFINLLINKVCLFLKVFGILPQHKDGKQHSRKVSLKEKKNIQERCLKNRLSINKVV